MKKRGISTVFITLLLFLFLYGCSINEPSETKQYTGTTIEIHFPSVADENIALTPQEIFETISPSVVEVHTYDKDGDPLKLGTGFFINDHGEIVTNYHVIDGASTATVITLDGKTHQIEKVIDFSSDIDIALLSINLQGNAWLEAETTDVKTGDPVYALGSSLGLTNTFSDGIVSFANHEENGVKYIQTTAPISSGNSGGPLVNSFGKVVGINTWGYQNGQNINFAIAISELEKLNDPKNLPVSYFEATESSQMSLGTGIYEFFLDVTFRDGKTTSCTIHTNSTTVGKALYELGIVDGDDFDNGLVDTVFGEKLDWNADQMYWAFFINGEYAINSLDQTPIISGAHYALTATAG